MPSNALEDKLKAHSGMENDNIMQSGFFFFFKGKDLVSVLPNRHTNIRAAAERRAHPSKLQEMMDGSEENCRGDTGRDFK